MSIFVDMTRFPWDFDFEISGTMPNINIDADPIEFTATVKAVFSSYPAADRNPDLDLYYDCLDYDRFGVLGRGVLDFDTSISGSWLNKTHDADVFEFSASISGSFVEGTVIDSDVLAFDFSLDGDLTIEMAKTSWVKWSKIGYLDFTIDQKNQAGERPMEWVGTIYDIFKLDKSVIVYGSNGISVMRPVRNTFDYKTIYDKGTLGRNAQISNSINTIHWFVDVVGDLYEVSGEGIREIGYSEYLSNLTGPVMSINEKDHLIYICDGTTGYVYSYRDRSLGQCAPDISGYGYKNMTEYPVASSVITHPSIEFTTDILDLGTKKEKTIFNLEVGTNVGQQMEAAIEYRMDHKSSFAVTPWVIFTQHGIAYLPCYGREFRIKFRMNTYEAFDIDQFKINGVVHGFSFLDTVRKEN